MLPVRRPQEILSDLVAVEALGIGKLVSFVNGRDAVETLLDTNYSITNDNIAASVTWMKG